MKLITYAVYGVSQVLYKLFGVNTSVRKAWLKQQADRLQDQLDKEHIIKLRVNTRLNEVYTTKKAMEVAEANNWIWVVKIRGNESGAESLDFASYFLSAHTPNKVIAHKINKNLKIAINFLTIASSFIIVVNFTTDLY